MYLCLGTERQRRLIQYYPDLKIQEISTRDFWGRLTRLFVKERNVTFDRYEAFTRKQGKTESLEEFHCGLTELVVKGNFKCIACNDGGLESETIRDLFTANMSNDEVQKDLLAEKKITRTSVGLRGKTGEGSREPSSHPNKIVFIADTGSPTSFVNEKTANLLASTVKSAVKTKLGEDDEANRMVCYNGYKIPSLGRLIAPIESGGWTIQTASFIVVDDRRANIMGRNLLPQIGIELHQERKLIGKSELHVNNIDSSDTQIAAWVRTTYPGLCTRIGRSKNHMVHTQFLKEFKALQQRGRSDPIHIQERVENEILSLIDQGRIIRLEKCSDKQFISPIVITVKTDQSIKLAMDGFETNKQIYP